MIYIGPVFQSSAINFRGKAYISEKFFDLNMSQFFFLFFFEWRDVEKNSTKYQQRWLEIGTSKQLFTNLLT